METKSTSNFPRTRIKKLLQDLAEYEGKLNNRSAVRFQKEVVDFYDQYLADAIKVAFDDAIKITRLAKRSTMYLVDLTTSASLKSGSINQSKTDSVC